MTIRELITELVKSNLDSEIIIKNEGMYGAYVFYDIFKINMDKSQVELEILVNSD